MVNFEAAKLLDVGPFGLVLHAICRVFKSLDPGGREREGGQAEWVPL